MKVLWFTATPSLYKSGINAYNGGGWISSIESEMRKCSDIELGISFIFDGQPKKVKQDGVTYYPIPQSKEKAALRLWHTFFNVLQSERDSWPIWMRHLKEVVCDFHPDVIQVFGSEAIYGLVSLVTNIPIVLHIQGLICPCENAFYPPGISKKNFILQDLNPIDIIKRLRNIAMLKQAAMREREIFRHTSHFIGRTTWDRHCVEIMHPGATYYYGSEILRDTFYTEGQRQLTEQLRIVSTISSPMYKGFDLVLKTAKLLCESGLKIEWRVFGNVDPRVSERFTGIHHKEVGVQICGVVSATQLRDEILNCTVYAHTSYIDNSPNAVCEAQLLGVPVVATHVGGTPTLIEEGVTGYTVPANDPWQMAAMLSLLHTNHKHNIEMGQKARAVALKRHDKQNIVNGLIDIYTRILKQK